MCTLIMTLDSQSGQTGRSLVVDLEVVVNHGLLVHVLGGRKKKEDPED